MFDFWVSDKMEFSADDKRACFETAKTIVMMANKVRSGGILALEDDIDSIKNNLLKAAVQLIVDGVHEIELRKILENWIISNNRRGKELFESILILDGMLAIQRVSNPTFVYESALGSLFGEDLMPEYTEYIDYKKITQDMRQLTTDEFFEKMKGMMGFVDLGENENKMEILGTFDDMALQILIRETAPNDLIVAFKGSSENVMRKVLSNMSHRSASMMMGSCLILNDIRKEHIIAAQNRIWDKVKELEKSGQIVVSKK